MTRPILIPLDRSEIPQGEPLPYPVFDADYTLLCAQGHIVASKPELDSLLEIGLFRQPDWQSHSCQPQLPNLPPLGHADEPPASFEQVGLQPGTILHVRRAGGELLAFDTVKLVGWVKDEDLLISPVNQYGEPLPYRAGDQLEIKLLAGKGIVSFFSEITEFGSEQHAYLHLKYPEKIEYRRLRKNLRVDVGLLVSANGQTDTLDHEGRLSNLSACGGLLELNQLIALVDEDIQLTLSLSAAGMQHSLQLHARVRNLYTDERGDVPQVLYGLEFLDVAAPERLVLEHYVFQSLVEHTL
ncbi:flagellar brake protein [Formivibrio citricus]|nr:flagellar brake protein [Formivibrio citricus]